MVSSISKKSKICTQFELKYDTDGTIARYNLCKREYSYMSTTFTMVVDYGTHHKQNS